jgi:hypothetical protein
VVGLIVTDSYDPVGGEVVNPGLRIDHQDGRMRGNDKLRGFFEQVVNPHHGLVGTNFPEKYILLFFKQTPSEARYLNTVELKVPGQHFPETLSLRKILGQTNITPRDKINCFLPY